MFHDHFDPRYYTVRCVFGMNELYCTGPEIGKADSVRPPSEAIGAIMLEGSPHLLHGL